MLQIIKRHEGHKSIVEDIEKGRIQFSYNSDGHIIIRVIHDDSRDSLVVLDKRSSNSLISFLTRNRMPF